MLLSSKKSRAQQALPSTAKVEGQASNLTGQLKELDFHEIKEGDAIYYLAETQISNGEFLKFELKVTPAGKTDAATIHFDKRFFTINRVLNNSIAENSLADVSDGEFSA